MIGLSEAHTPPFPPQPYAVGPAMDTPTAALNAAGARSAASPVTGVTPRGISDPAAHSGGERIHDRDAVDLSTRLEIFG